MRESHDLLGGDADDFTVRNQTEIAQAATSTTSVMTGLLAAIASISLVVGGIGIMNIMLVSVTERTREIGIRMAIGARGSDVLTQFLVESVVMSLLGGMVGLALGFGGAALLGHVTGWSTATPIVAVFVAVGFSAGGRGVLRLLSGAKGGGAQSDPGAALRVKKDRSGMECMAGTQSTRIDAQMRVSNGKLTALTLALMMAIGGVTKVKAEGAAGDTARAGTPITFEDAVQIALKQNITLAQAQNSAATDAATVRGAKLSFLPNLQLSTSGSQAYGRNFSETTGDVLSRNNQSVNAGISSSVTLFNGLANVANLHEAEKNQDAGLLDLTRARQTTVFTVASNYLSIITAQEQLKVQQENLASLQAQEDQIKKW